MYFSLLSVAYYAKCANNQLYLARVSLITHSFTLYRGTLVIVTFRCGFVFPNEIILA